MKSTIAAALLVIYATAVSALSDLTQITVYKEGDRFVIFADKYGVIEIIDLEATEPHHRFHAEKDTKFWLYTQENPVIPQYIEYNNIDILRNSSYDHSKPTKIIAHGWNNDGSSDSCILVKDKFLESLDVNVICVDWGKGASAFYTTSVGYVPKVGNITAQLIDWFISDGSSLKNFHIMGHSLGGHIAGIAGRYMTSGKVPYITAFDPANPLWGSNSQRIRPGDAEYVEVIHTNSGNLGLEEPVGDNDFYPNGGSGMPGCSIVNVGCSHGRSYEYFAYSIGNKNFMANECSTLGEVLKDKCSNLSQLHMGGEEPKEARGLFLLQTEKHAPFFLTEKYFKRRHRLSNLIHKIRG